jgi:hypothetical protein
MHFPQPSKDDKPTVCSNSITFSFYSSYICYVFECFLHENNVNTRAWDWLRVGRHGDWFPAETETFLYATTSRPVLGFTQPSIQWIPELPSLAVKHLWLQLMQKLRKHEAISSLLHTSSWCYTFPTGHDSESVPSTSQPVSLRSSHHTLQLSKYL